MDAEENVVNDDEAATGGASKRRWRAASTRSSKNTASQRSTLSAVSRPGGDGPPDAEGGARDADGAPRRASRWVAARRSEPRTETRIDRVRERGGDWTGRDGRGDRGEAPTDQIPAVAGDGHGDGHGRYEDPPEPVIELRSVTKSFGSHTVLQDITFDVPKGRTTAIMGPSGTGKSVLLKNIIGLLRPDGGEIWVEGENIVGMRDKDLYRVRKKFGVLFQDGALFGSMSLYDNIAFPLREHTRKSEKEVRELVHKNAELVGLMDHLKKLPGEVSGGMKKRAGLARAMVMEPDIILFDEPDSGLDPVRVAYLDNLVRKAQAETGATFFIITHNIPSVMRTADYIGILFRSELVRFAHKEDMRADTNPIIRQFLAGKAKGPIGMDEMAAEDDGRFADLEEDEEAQQGEIMTV